MIFVFICKTKAAFISWWFYIRISTLPWEQYAIIEYELLVRKYQIKRSSHSNYHEYILLKKLQLQMYPISLGGLQRNQGVGLQKRSGYGTRVETLAQSKGHVIKRTGGRLPRWEQSYRSLCCWPSLSCHKL